MQTNQAPRDHWPAALESAHRVGDAMRHERATKRYLPIASRACECGADMIYGRKTITTHDDARAIWSQAQASGLPMVDHSYTCVGGCRRVAHMLLDRDAVLVRYVGKTAAPVW